MGIGGEIAKPNPRLSNWELRRGKHRSDNYEIQYKDEGCHLHPACLTCSRDACFYDDKKSAGRKKKISSN